MPGNGGGSGGGGGGKGPKYTFVLCRGNYSGVVRAALARRPWWRDAVLEQCGRHARSTVSTETTKNTKTTRTTASQRKRTSQVEACLAEIGRLGFACKPGNGSNIPVAVLNSSWFFNGQPPFGRRKRRILLTPVTAL